MPQLHACVDDVAYLQADPLQFPAVAELDRNPQAACIQHGLEAVQTIGNVDGDPSITTEINIHRPVVEDRRGPRRHLPDPAILHLDP